MFYLKKNNKLLTGVNPNLIVIISQDVFHQRIVTTIFLGVVIPVILDILGSEKQAFVWRYKIVTQLIIEIVI